MEKKRNRLRRPSTVPNHQRWYAKWKLSSGICTHCIHAFAGLAPILHAQSVLSNKISASELSRKFITSELLVGKDFSLQSPVEEIASINLAMLELKSTCSFACPLAHFRSGHSAGPTAPGSP